MPPAISTVKMLYQVEKQYSWWKNTIDKAYDSFLWKFTIELTILIRKAKPGTETGTITRPNTHMSSQAPLLIYNSYMVIDRRWVPTEKRFIKQQLLYMITSSFHATGISNLSSLN